MPQKIDHSKAQDALNAYTSHGGERPAAESLGISRSSLRDRLDNAKRYGLKPQTQALAAPAAGPPPGYKLKGTSTLYGEDGQQKLQWVKTDAALEQLYAAQRAALKDLQCTIKPYKIAKAPKNTIADLLTLYTMTDCHIGMLAWDKEAGEDWDISIAEKVLTETLLRMIEAAPASAIGILNQLGDFLHFDSLTPMTPTSKHVLDADSRYQKVVVVALRILRRVLDAMLLKHAFVHMEIKEGNHDPAGSVWQRVIFSELYKLNKRVSVSLSPNPYTTYQHGETFLGFHHGHLSKKDKLPLLFAAKFAREWGSTQYRYIHTGHLHHTHEVEHPGVTVMQHPTLAAADAYAARYGFLSVRKATSVTYDKKVGEVFRGTFVPKS